MPKIIVHFDPRFQHSCFPNYHPSTLNGKIPKKEYQELIKTLSQGMLEAYSTPTHLLKFLSKSASVDKKLKKYKKLIHNEGMRINKEYGIRLSFNFLDFRNNSIQLEWDSPDDFEPVEYSKEFECNVVCERCVMHIYFQGVGISNAMPDYGYGNKFGEYGKKYDNPKDEDGISEIIYLHKKTMRKSVYLYKYF